MVKTKGAIGLSVKAGICERNLTAGDYRIVRCYFIMPYDKFASQETVEFENRFSKILYKLVSHFFEYT